MVVTLQDFTPSYDLKYIVPEDRLARLQLAGLQIYRHLTESLTFPGASRFEVSIDFNLYRNVIYIRGSLPSSKYAALVSYVEPAFYRTSAETRLSPLGAVMAAYLSYMRPFLPHYLEPVVHFSLHVETEKFDQPQAFPRAKSPQRAPFQPDPAVDAATMRARALYNEVLTLKSKLPRRVTAFVYTVSEPPCLTVYGSDSARYLTDVATWTRQAELIKAFIHQRLASTSPPSPPAPTHAKAPRRVHPAHVEHALSQLGLAPDLIVDDSNRHVLKEAWKRKVLQSHPDKGGSTTLQQAVNDAKDVLIQEGLYPLSTRFS